MSETKTYQGGCHCGAVRFEVEMDLQDGATCNCSICEKSGTVLTFVPASAFKLLQGEDGLRDYQFGKKKLHHLFCTTCGIRSFSRGAKPDGTEMAAVNVRCLDGIDLASVPTKQFQGRDL